MKWQMSTQTNYAYADYNLTSNTLFQEVYFRCLSFKECLPLLGLYY